MEKPKAPHNHFLLLTWPAQGHINPTLQFAKQLLESGAQVTIATTPSTYILKNEATSSLEANLHLATFSGDFNSQESSLAEVFAKNVGNGTPFTCMVHTNLLGWSVNVATRFNVPSILLWLQSGTVFNLYYHYFDQYRDFVQDYCEKDPSWSLNIPNWPFSLKVTDIPSYLLPSSPHSSALLLFHKNVEKLKDGEEKRVILVNTVDDLEASTLRSVDGLELIPVGPLLLSDKSFGSDLFKQHKDDEEYYAKWLDAQETSSSVIYISFGSFWGISKVQINELARALIEIQRPFLWVVKENNCDDMSCLTELKKHDGLIVPWCWQTKVLSHPSVGCFMTHCGWNSTLESISCGVPMVAFPLSSDQMTNAKLIEDVWEVGVRVNMSEQEGVVKSEEIKRCLEVVVEDQRMKDNVVKLKNLAVGATQEGGSSLRNFKAFLEDYGVSNNCYSRVLRN